jgi:hypothetical protein
MRKIDISIGDPEVSKHFGRRVHESMLSTETSNHEPLEPSNAVTSAFKEPDSILKLKSTAKLEWVPRVTIL